MEIKDRIRMIMEKEKVPPRVFAETIGVLQSTLSHILNDRNKPSLDVVMKIHQTYHYVNLEWLLYGKGEMVSPAESTPSDPVAAKESYSSLFDGDDAVSKQSPELEDHEETVQRIELAGAKEAIKPEIRYVEKPAKRITEIRIFFDDNTYEIFRPDNK